MLAKKRLIAGIKGGRTPMLLPSLSSKSGVPAVPESMPRFFPELMSDPTLISAYDVFYRLGESPEFAKIIFLDSGGYEALRDAQAAYEGDRRGVENHPWNEDIYRKVLEEFPFSQPVVAVSFDHPDHPLPLEQQLDRADRLFPEREDLLREFLIKPNPGEAFIDIETVKLHLERLRQYPIIGMTDKELGESLFEKMQSVAKIRRALTDIGSEVPIHVFGSLDPLTAPLYFIAGADIFDGLAWLKYAFDAGRAIYPQNFEGVQLGSRQNTQVNTTRMWNHNYYYLATLQEAMRRFLQTKDYSHFGENGRLLEQAWVNLAESLED